MIDLVNCVGGMLVVGMESIDLEIEILGVEILCDVIDM